MMFRKLGLINRNQRGFTLVELIIAIAVSGIIASATTGAIFQLMNDSARSNNHMTAVRQVQNAGYWFSRDALMAKSVSLSAAGDSFLAILSRNDFDGNTYQVDYSLVGNKLRQDFVTYDADGALIDSGSSVVAQYIAHISCLQYECTIPLCGESFATLAELEAHFASEHPGTPVEYEKSALILTATATVGTGPQEESETRVYRIVPRTGL